MDTTTPFAKPFNALVFNTAKWRSSTLILQTGDPISQLYQLHQKNFLDNRPKFDFEDVCGQFQYGTQVFYTKDLNWKCTATATFRTGGRSVSITKTATWVSKDLAKWHAALAVMREINPCVLEPVDAPTSDSSSDTSDTDSSDNTTASNTQNDAATSNDNSIMSWKKTSYITEPTYRLKGNTLIPDLIQRARNALVLEAHARHIQTASAVRNSHESSTTTETTMPTEGTDHNEVANDNVDDVRQADTSFAQMKEVEEVEDLLIFSDDES